MTIHDRYVTANGLRFHYREAGKPDAAAVLILHGLGGNAWEFDEVTEALAERYRVVALNQRGHGASDWADGYSVDLMAGDVASVVDALGLALVRVIAHSMGGLNALAFAARHPDMLERLVIADVGPDSLTADKVAGVSAGLEAAAQAVYANPEDALAEWVAATPRPREAALRHFVVHNLRRTEDGRWAWRYDAAGLRRWLEALPPSEALWDAFRRIACPVLVLRAAESWVLDRPGLERMGREHPGARAIEVAESGHDMHIEQPDAVIEALRAFLDE